ncbi:MAG TPA: hypothetical protein VEC35_00310 [Noviherbaspirillum sp.]|nr:hypothetical protein [Noviherbaspirillum sp.]
MESEIAKLDAVQSRLREVIRSIVQRHVAKGNALSWQLMFDIEEEALRLLDADPGLDAHYIRLMVPLPLVPQQKAGAPAGMQDLNAIRTTLWMIQEAYYHGR